MKSSQFSENAQLLAFVLQPGEQWLPEVIDALERTWGKIRHKGKLFAFDQRPKRLLPKKNAAMRWNSRWRRRAILMRAA